uniref:Protein phosphatase 2C n=1 Tax=Trepomonas sp. PC1 TaxID=1076344 RepID=A0A146K6M2_9EUKA|eukprot:JAP92492.1 Protein phosphatase 2C [Trepomonas sp. PC1]
MQLKDNQKQTQLNNQLQEKQKLQLENQAQNLTLNLNQLKEDLLELQRGANKNYYDFQLILNDAAQNLVQDDIKQNYINFLLEKTAEKTETLTGSSSIQGRRYNNEDFHLINTEDDILMAVFDGHGGQAAAEFAKARFGQVLKQQLEKSLLLETSQNLDFQLESPVEQALKRTFEQIDAEFCSLKQESGCTAAVLFIKNEKFYLANCGDARVLLNNQNQILSTIDHKPSVQAEKMRIEAAGGSVRVVNGIHRVAGMLAVSRAIGDYQYKNMGVTSTPDVQVFEEVDHKYAVVACDGLFDVFTNEEVDVIVKTCLGEVLTELVDRQYILQDAANYYMQNEIQVADSILFELSSAYFDESQCQSFNDAMSLAERISAILTRMAYVLGSNDNITVLVMVQQMQQIPHEEQFSILQQCFQFLQDCMIQQQIQLQEEKIQLGEQNQLLKAQNDEDRRQSETKLEIALKQQENAKQKEVLQIQSRFQQQIDQMQNLQSEKDLQIENQTVQLSLLQQHIQDFKDKLEKTEQSTSELKSQIQNLETEKFALMKQIKDLQLNQTLLTNQKQLLEAELKHVDAEFHEFQLETLEKEETAREKQTDIENALKETKKTNQTLEKQIIKDKITYNEQIKEVQDKGSLQLKEFQLRQQNQLKKQLNFTIFGLTMVIAMLTWVYAAGRGLIR